MTESRIVRKEGYCFYSNMDSIDINDKFCHRAQICITQEFQGLDFDVKKLTPIRNKVQVKSQNITYIIPTKNKFIIILQNPIVKKMQGLKNTNYNQNKLKTSKTTFKQSLMGAWQSIDLFLSTNIIYKLGVLGGIKRVPQILRTTSTNCCVIFGELILDQMIAKQRLAKIIWFTYRDKLKIAEDINSDVGWGCMPRVGQMVLAQALVRHFVLKNKSLDQKLYLKIIQPFLDSSEQCAGYSLSTILKYARWKFGINPGDWFNIGQLSQVLRKIQDDIPLKGSQDLKIVFFNQSVIFIDVMEEKANIDKCRCFNKKIFCRQCQKCRDPELDVKDQLKYSQKKESIKQEKNSQSKQIVLTIQQYDSGERVVSQKQEQEQQPVKQVIEKKWQIYDQKNEQLQVPKEINQKKSNISENMPQQTKLKNSLLMIVSVRIAQKTIEKFDIEPILSLLSLNSSLGFIGGVPNKALYIVGYEGNELIYLDPHYVQQHVDKSNYVEHLNTFFCPEYRTISIQALDPSMAFCYYLQTIEDVQKLLMRIEQLKQLYDKSGRTFFISVMEKSVFEEEMRSPGRTGNDSSCEHNVSFEYSSLEFRDISDSF